MQPHSDIYFLIIKYFKSKMDDFLERLSFVNTSQTVKRRRKFLLKLILFINQ